MFSYSDIEWTQLAWNPTTGCTKISAGCKHCYAEKQSHRMKAMGKPGYHDGFQLTLQPNRLDWPLHKKKPKVIFVNSMSDLFHQDVPSSYIKRVFETMKEAHWHKFQVLTKRAERLEEVAKDLDWPENIWMGVSVENEAAMTRIENLRRVPAATRFLSIEPLIGPLPSLDLDGIHWVIVGGESGPGCRPMDPQWVRDIRDQCERDGVPFFFKQWGGRNKKATGRLLDGRTYEEMPGGVSMNED